MNSNSERHMSANDLYRLKTILDARISPDGRHVIYVVERVDRKTEKKHSNLWLRSTRGRGVRQFTYGDHSDNTPRWSPDGKQIAFLSNRNNGKSPQVFLIPFDGGEARQLTELKGEIGQLDWSPDGRRLLCAFRRSDKEVIEREEDEQKKKLGVVARHITRTLYKFDGAGYLPKERWHVCTISARSGKLKHLTDGAIYDELEPAWSPDGQSIVFRSNRSEEPDLAPGRDDLFVISANGGPMRSIPAPEGPKALPAFSPDGNTIAYLGIEGVGQYWRNFGLWIVPTDGSRPAVNLTEGHDLHVASLTATDTGGGAMVRPVWSGDGKRIYFQVSRQGDTALMEIEAGTTLPEVRRVVESPGVLGPFTIDQSGDKLAYVLNTTGAPSQLRLREFAHNRDILLADLNMRWLDRLDLGQLEEFWFNASDGYHLHGWILKPPGFDPRRAYPSILEIHGGPHVQYGRGFMHEFYFLAAHGYVVYFSNPRGGQGYGERHCRAIWNQWGTIDYEDVMALADFMAQKPYIDPDRMGVTGGSYGGYMTNMIIGRTNRFKAAVTQRSVSNLTSMWGSSDGNWRFQQSFADDKPPFDNLQKYWDASPMKYIGNATTPTLVIHSEKDLRVAQEQGEQVFVALKKLGVDTELVLFPEEPHGLSRVGRTDRRIIRLNHILRWFDKYLKA